MTLRGFRIPVVLAVMSLTLGVLLLATHLYRRHAVVSPLARRCGEVPGVEEVTVRQDGGQAVIRLRLGAVDDLRATYVGAEEAARAVLAPDRFRLVVEDARTPELREAYRKVHYLVYEAAARGTFSLLAEAEGHLEASGWQARLQVDERFVYVEIYDVRGGYLYEVVPLSASVAQ